MPSIWRAPAGTIPSAEAVQAREHPCGQSLPSSLTRPLSHAASLAERFRTLLPLIPHVANATMAQPQVRSASLQSQAPQRKQQQLRVRSRPSPPLRSYPVRPQRTRSRVPMTRRFLHNAPWLSSVSRCLGPTQRRDPVSSSIGGQPHQLIAQRRPITASSGGQAVSIISALDLVGLSSHGLEREHDHALHAHCCRTCPFFDCFCYGLGSSTGQH